MKTVHINDVFTREAKHTRDTHLTDNFNRELHCNNKCTCTFWSDFCGYLIRLFERIFKWGQYSCWDSKSVTVFSLI